MERPKSNIHLRYFWAVPSPDMSWGSLHCREQRLTPGSLTEGWLGEAVVIHCENTCGAIMEMDYPRSSRAGTMVGEALRSIQQKFSGSQGTPGTRASQLLDLGSCQLLTRLSSSLFSPFFTNWLLHLLLSIYFHSIQHTYNVFS